MEPAFCPGYTRSPFDVLAADPPGEDVYPSGYFRVGWGPIFHRGRLDGAARVLVLGQDPATHETITRRILVGEAGQRVQGLLTRIGLPRSYVMINTFLYSVYGQRGGARHAKDPAIAEYRNRWLDALLAGGQVTAVITLGGLAKTAYTTWAGTRPDTAAGLHPAAVTHPTYPESAAAAGRTTHAEATAALLADWNTQLPALHAHVTPEEPPNPQPYGENWQDADLVAIPAADLPAGSPAWWRSLHSWATRTGRDVHTKRATITVTVPTDARTWPVAPAPTPGSAPPDPTPGDHPPRP